MRHNVQQMLILLVVVVIRVPFLIELFWVAFGAGVVLMTPVWTSDIKITKLTRDGLLQLTMKNSNSHGSATEDFKC
eukprot:4516410-Amphidinium_carterae.1